MSFLIKTWKPVGEPVKKTSHTEQTINCRLAKKTVILKISPKGVVTCEDWRSCEHHGKKGLVPCPKVVAQKIVLQKLKESGKKRVR